MAIFQCTYRELVDVYLECERNLDKFMEKIHSSYGHLTPNHRESICRYLTQTFLPHFNRRWQGAGRNKKTFFNQYSNWLEHTCCINEPEKEPCSTSRQEPGTSGVGRPCKPFEECSERTKQSKIKHILDTVSEELISAAHTKIKNKKSCPVYSPEKALALLVDAGLSKDDYCLLRKSSNEIGSDIYPTYDEVLVAKKKCYPCDIEISETFAKVTLQSLLDHTTERIFLTVPQSDLFLLNDKFVLISKWGCDGSSGHSEYKQRFKDVNATDASMFLTSLVPLRLLIKDSSILLWENPRPASTRYCRPLQFKFEKETPDVVKEEVQRVKIEISQLNDTIINIHNKIVTVSHTLVFSMIDGKVIQAVSETSSMSVCPICKAKPSEMNDIESLETKPECEEAIRLGMSPLHARIKFMECILHIAYNSSFQAWRTTKETKQQKEDTKRDIQEKFKRLLGLKVDVVKQGLGTSNDGNTSRRFFEHPAVTAEITGVNEDLIHRFGIILNTMSSGALIDSRKFGQYCRETAHLYVTHYKWYNMPNTVHKVLCHGSTIIAASILPIGMLTEEAQEARNKDYRLYRRDHSRKTSRTSTNEDVFNFLMLSSDPYISSLRTEPKTKESGKFHEDIKKLVL